MRARLWVSSLVASLFILTLPVAQMAGATESNQTPAPVAPDKVSYVADRALVGVDEGAKASARDTVVSSGGEILDYYRAGRFFVVDTPEDSKSWALDVRGDAGVAFAEPDYLVSTQEVIPNDPQWSSMWGLQKIGMPSAWETTKGSTSVVVGVVDTGIDYRHEDLASQMWTNPGEIAGDGIDNDANGYIDDVHGIDCANNDSDPLDDNDHGTHVAGTIGAATGNSKGVAGINWNVGLMALKFMTARGTGAVSDAVECIDYAWREGAQVTNHSWGGGGYSQALYDAFARARSAGQLSVAAAGNSGYDTDAVPSYPASYDLDNVVSVAATGQTDALASFSNFGANTVDIAAPGVSILSTVRGDSYASFNGTSMASPHVAGAAALVLAAYPGSSYRQVLDRLYGSADRLASLTGKVASGRLDVAGAVAADPVAPGATGLAVTGTTRTSVSVSWSAPADDGSSGGSVASYELAYSPAGQSSWAPAPAPAPVSPGTTQNAVISALRPGHAYDVRLVSVDDAGNRSGTSSSATTSAGSELFVDDMESGSGKWTVSGGWAITSEHPHSPTRSWSDSPSGPYGNSSQTSIVSTPFSLNGTSDPVLGFWHRFTLERNYDIAYVEVSTDGGSTWAELAHYTAGSPFAPVQLSLASYAGAQQAQIRFRLRSDWSVVHDGWFIDDVVVSAAGGSTPPPAPGPDPAPPAAPRNLVVRDALIGGTLDLDWSDNTEFDLAGYNVYRTATPATTSRGGSTTRVWTKLNPSPTTGSSYRDSGLANGTTYYYHVTAVDTGGAESGVSNEASGAPSYSSTTDVTPPAAPTGVTAAAGNGRVDVNWSDNGESDIASYRVYRTTDGPGSSSRVWSLIAQPTASEATDTAVVNGTTYYYVVAAVDSSSNESARSSEVGATPSSGGGGGGGAQDSFPSAATILVGSGMGDGVSNLQGDDGQYYRVAASANGRGYVADWFASVPVSTAGVSGFTLTYNGSCSSSCSQSLYVYNFPSNQWEYLSSATVSSGDQTFDRTFSSLSTYVSSSGSLRFRVAASAGTSFTSRGDLIRVRTY